MATPVEALFSASLGLIGGVLGAIAIERLKAGVASLEAEFVRLDTIEDELFEIFEMPADMGDRSSALRRLVSKRRRLGQNIRRKVIDGEAYKSCKTQLVLLDGFLAKAEDAVPLTDDIERDIEAAIARLRSQLRRSSKTAKAFAFLRGDA